jgi:hypothetical protein
VVDHLARGIRRACVLVGGQSLQRPSTQRVALACPLDSDSGLAVRVGWTKG